MSKYNLRLIKSKRSYSINEMVSLLKVNRKTCHRWIKNDGLRPIERNTNPLLVMGEVLKKFLKERIEKRRFELGKNEFFCMKCRKPVKAKMGSEKVIKTGKRIGKIDLEQRKKTGICGVCGTEINKFLKVYQRD